MSQTDGSVFGGSDWWSNALAQSDVINCDDYDSLMREEEGEAYVTTDGTSSKDKVRAVLLRSVCTELHFCD